MEKYRKVLIFIGIVALGLLLSNKLGFSYFNDSNLKIVLEIVDKNYALAVILYLIFTMIGSSILALPGVLFAVVASTLFGSLMGSIYCLIGATIGAFLSFLLSRYLLKDFVKELVKKNERLNRILFEVDSKKEILILMITRLLPIFPFNLQNFAYGITDISAIKYTLGTFIFMIPGVVVFSVGTEGIVNEVSKNMIILSAIIVIFTIILSIFLYRKYKLLMVEDCNER